MTIKNRIRKLEGARRGGATAHACRFTQEFREEGANLFFIDRVPVDAERYARELADYARLHKDSLIPLEEIVYPNGISSVESIILVTHEV